MRVELFGLTMDAPGVTAYLWSPWRCAAIEHKLFESLAQIPGTKLEKDADELRVQITDGKAWKQAVANLSRVLKGWQEESVDAGGDRRTWRMMLEGDVDANGYDHKGERSAFWLFLRLGLERGGPGDGEKAEDIDLNGFGLCVWSSEEE